MATKLFNKILSSDVKLKKPEIVKKLSDGNLEFALNLYSAITNSQGDGTNAFFSPLSITVALSMLSAGARNNTATELRETLHLDVLEEDKDVHAAFKDILKSLSPTANASFDLDIANRIYIDDSYTLVADYLATLTDSYFAKAVATSFTKEAEKTRKEINSWVERVTKHKIKDVLAEGDLGNKTRLILINAIYFKGNWKVKFHSERTYDRPFFRKNDNQISVKMMNLTSEFLFAEVYEYECKILELPYTGDRLSMLLILPDRVEGLAKLEASLTAKAFRFIVGSLLNKTKVIVTLPTFKLELGTYLAPILQELGIKEAFEEFGADLTGISGSSPENRLYVTKVIHKSFVEVNEKGTEAAAVTAVSNGLARMCLPPPVTEFRVDHPFIFAIYDNLTKMVLFLGRLTDPPRF